MHKSKREIENIGIQEKINRDLLTAGLDYFFRVVRIGFSARRKQLHNNLSYGLGLDQQLIKSEIEKLIHNKLIRPQELSLKHWILLANNLAQLRSNEN